VTFPPDERRSREVAVFSDGGDPIVLNGERERLGVTFFPNFAAQTLTAKEMSLTELRGLILSTTAARKDALPWLKLAMFGDERTRNNSLRHNANVKAITGVELDYDAEEMTFEEAVAILANARLWSLVYTSPSHTAAKPRWRILLPTSSDRPVEERARLCARVNGVFAGILAPESFVLSQAYYFGRVGSNPDHRVAIVDGDFVDLRDDLDAGAMGKTNGKAIDHTPHVPSGQIRADEEEIAFAVEVIPNNARDWEFMAHRIFNPAQRPAAKRSAHMTGTGTPSRPLTKLRTIDETAELFNTSTRTLARAHCQRTAWYAGGGPATRPPNAERGSET
jgi:hypothetical protein